SPRPSRELEVRRFVRIGSLTTLGLLVVPSWVAAQGQSQLQLKLDGVGVVSAPLQIVVLLTLLTLLPALLMTLTCFTRIVIAFHFLRQALGTQEMPSNQILVGLALFLTIFVMAPVGDRINADAVQPVMAGKLDVTAALDRATPPIRDFMLHQTREKDLA